MVLMARTILKHS